MGIDFYKSTFPEWYKDWLFKSLQIKDGQESSERYLGPLFSLNKNWLEENYQQSEYSWNESDVAKSYALFYMTINIPKLWMTLKHSGNWQDEVLPQIESITEFGCGPGTFLWSYFFYLYKWNRPALRKIKKIKALDISSEQLKVAEALFKELKKYKSFKHIEAEFVLGDWKEAYEEHISDLNIFGNSLIESGMNEDFLQNPQLQNVLIIEPGTKKQFHRLKDIKNSLNNELWNIHFPCPTMGKCPMSESNWCHFSVNRFIQPFIQRMSSAAKRKNHKHNFSAFLISKHNNNLNDQNFRVLSANRKVKRTSIRYVCNGKKLVEAVLSRKERSEQNRDFINCETASCCYTSSKLKNSRILTTDKFTQFSNLD